MARTALPDLQLSLQFADPAHRALLPRHKVARWIRAGLELAKEVRKVPRVMRQIRIHLEEVAVVLMQSELERGGIGGAESQFAWAMQNPHALVTG